MPESTLSPVQGPLDLASGTVGSIPEVHGSEAEEGDDAGREKRMEDLVVDGCRNEGWVILHSFCVQYSLLFCIIFLDGCQTQSTYIYRIPQCISPRWNWDNPTPSPRRRVCTPPLVPGGGAQSPAGEGLGESQFRRLEKKLSTLPTL
jgi:hypothetical protein